MGSSVKSVRLKSKDKSTRKLQNVSESSLINIYAVTTSRLVLLPKLNIWEHRRHVLPNTKKSILKSTMDTKGLPFTLVHVRNDSSPLKNRIYPLPTLTTSRKKKRSRHLNCRRPKISDLSTKLSSAKSKYLARKPTI